MKVIINIIRYLLSCLFVICFFYVLTEKTIMAIAFLLLAISCLPLFYQLIFKNSEISNESKVKIQIFAPIVVFIVMSAIVGFTS